MSDGIYENVIRTESERMVGERVEMMVAIYESTDGVRDQDIGTETNTQQPPQNTGSDGVKSRRYRAAPVLLCFLLLTAVIVLCVFIYTNYTQEGNETLTSITNDTEERDELLNSNTKLKEERNQLSNNTLSNNDDLMNQGGWLEQEKNDLQESDGWSCYQSSCYFISSEKKNWTESRRDCRDRGADLTIINNREEQDLVRKLSNREYVWIGLTDREEEGRWKWVDGSNMTSGFRFWGFWEPNGYKQENCALSRPWWADYPCDYTFQWVCEKH